MKTAVRHLPNPPGGKDGGGTVPASLAWQAALTGFFFFVVIVKLGDPVIIDAANAPLRSLDEVIFDSWPPAWGRWLLVPLILIGLTSIRWKEARFRWALAAPLVWLLWQFVAASQTVDGTLTGFTLPHFVACVALFYLGYFGLNGWRWPWPVMAGMAVGLCWVMRNGMEQHFGGLAATHDYIHKMYGDRWSEITAVHPDFAKRIDDPRRRIFASFVSPNAFAATVLLFMPMTLVLVWQAMPKVSRGGRMGFVLILGLCGLAILYWTQSKTGWLLALALGVIVLAHSTLSWRWKTGVIASLIVLGLIGFAIRNSRYFERGATSVSARFDYWKAAVQTIREHPVVGSGPGTFMRPYARLKDPKSEMTRLCHNDYLEQASDSGVIGGISYVFFIFWSVFDIIRSRFGANWRKEPLITAVALGVLAVCLHSMMEYHLYIPALAWPLFFLLGWLRRLE